MTLRPDWPVVDEAVAFDSNVTSSYQKPYPHWMSTLARTIRQNKVARGRQYELNIVQTGEYTATLDNRDGLLSSVNTASPVYSQIQPFVPLRKRLMWPPSINLLTQAQGAAGYGTAPNYNVDSQIPGWFTSWGTAWYNIATTNTVTNLGMIWRVTYSASPGNNTPLWDMDGVSLNPVATGLNPTFVGWNTYSVWVRCSTGTAGSSPAVAAQLKWRDTTGADRPAFSTLGTPVTLPVNSSAWVQVSVAGQAPSWATGVTLTLYSVTGQTCVLDVAANQFEHNNTASAWSLPGVWY